MQLPDEIIKKRARKVVDAGSVTLAHLQESIATNEKLDLLLSKEAPEYPEIEIPEYPTELAISNLPDIQKVEITNLPEEKDDKETQNLLKELVAEVKKKEQYTYDIEIDSTLKEQLRGAKGEDGKDGIDGLNGSPDTPDQVIGKIKESDKLIPKEKIEGLSDIERIAKSNVGGSSTTFVNGKLSKNINFSGATVSYSGDNANVLINASSGSGDVVGPTGATADAIARYDTTTGKLIKDSGITIADGATGVLSGTNTGDQLMYGTIAVTGQSDLDPTGTGDTLNVEAGANVTITTVPLTNTLTIEANVPNEDSFGIVVDGAGTAITTGSKGVRYIPWDCTITGWDIRSDISGSCVFDVKRSGTSLGGTEKPTLVASTSNQDLALSTWTTSLLTGDVVEFVVDSASTLTRATLTILVTKL